MPKPTLDQQDNMQDLVSNADYRLTFARIPGNPGLDLEKVALNCINAVIPGITINKADQRFAGGHKLSYAMSVNHAGTGAFQFVERADAQVIRWMRNWTEFCKNTRTGNGAGYKRDYAVSGRLEIFDGTGKTAIEIVLRNMFPSDFPEVSLDASAEGTPILHTLTMSIDWWDIVNGEYPLS